MKILLSSILLTTYIFAIENTNIPPLKQEVNNIQNTDKKTNNQDVSVESLVKILNAADEKAGLGQTQQVNLPPVSLERQNLKLAAIGFSEINGVKKGLILDNNNPVYVKIGDIYKGLKINNITKDYIAVGDGTERLYFTARNDIKYNEKSK